ncbi:unnamed protein product [Orchesella dallaii]|uniref:Uncharacterized protein n=1 Tax=Orchesella dallaii TaxID=48710 RepID=A0ABP1PMT3_9HEXA
MMLSTIAENDCSPYSTCSTSHAPNNSNVYPTTTSIFGRKPSPPPLDELPAVPVVMVSSPHSSKNSSLSHKSERDFIVRNHPGGGHNGGGLDNMAFNGDTTTIQMQSNDMTGRINEGYETEEGDDGRRYMTIAEVNESRVEFEKTLTVLPLQQPFTTPHDSERNPSDYLSSPSTEVSPTPVRHGMASILRQDAVCLTDMDSEVMIPTSISQTELPPLPIDSTTPVATQNLHNVHPQPTKASNVEIDNDDDGYHERVGVQSSLVGTSSSSALELEGEAPPSHNADTLKSNASDSHGSNFSVDQTLPIPSSHRDRKEFVGDNPNLTVPCQNQKVRVVLALYQEMKR